MTSFFQAMLSGDATIENLVSQYPIAWQEQMRRNFHSILRRDREKVAQAVHTILQQYHCCSVFAALQAQLTPPDACPNEVLLIPPEFNAQFQRDCQMMCGRDRKWVVSQIQMRIAEDHDCSAMQALRADIDSLLLNPDATP